VSPSSEFCRHNASCCLLTSVYCCRRIFRYRLSLETSGYSLVQEEEGMKDVDEINERQVGIREEVEEMVITE
jgi:hypothetical protein